jgi:PAS domain-containing protein
MSTFGALSTFRVGYWYGIRGFLLNERRDVASRIAVIEAELARIGKVSVQYKTVTEEDGSVKATEERVSMMVEERTSLERLLQAYIAQGGNPFDVSHFFMPDETMEVDQDAGGNAVLASPYPQEGVAAPQNEEYHSFDYEASQGGWVPLLKYTPNRAGDRTDRSSLAEPVTTYMIEARRWVGQEISEKLHNLEAKIIKLCDLREQLEQERDLLKATHGGTLSSVVESYHQPGGMYPNALRLQNIVATMDKIFFVTNEDGTVTAWEPAGKQLDPYRGIFWVDDPAEKALTMMA